MSQDKDFNFVIKPKEQKLEFTIKTKIYPVTAVYQTAYLFLDRVYIYLDGEPSKEIMVRMKLKAVSDSLAQSALAAKAHLEQLSGEFHNELLNQLLREKVSESNAKIREYIVAQALYSAVPNEVDELLKEVEEEDWQEDPLGIAKTWEETQNKKEEKSKKGSPSPRLRRLKKK